MVACRDVRGWIHESVMFLWTIVVLVTVAGHAQPAFHIGDYMTRSACNQGIINVSQHVRAKHHVQATFQCAVRA